ncbi:MAG: YbaK/EbsC family protein [Deltaproteobacteria bacterium]|nr:YbaK/EbsC family protein [Deltaproteobacteria bacterium]
MPMRKLKELLDAMDVDYVVTHHRPSYTAQETAQVCHIPGMNLAKTVVVHLNGNLAMTVLPAHYRVDIFKLRKFTGAWSLRVARESDFMAKFPDCEVGAMPPFGNLFGMVVFSEEALNHDLNISFNSGTHSEIITMPYDRWKDLVHPYVADFHR